MSVPLSNLVCSTRPGAQPEMANFAYEVGDTSQHDLIMRRLACLVPANIHVGHRKCPRIL